MIDVVEAYQSTLAAHPGMSIPVAAISALTSVIRASTASTMIELSKEMTAATDALQRATQHSVSVTAGCELFTRFISRTGNEVHELDFAEFKCRLLERGALFVDKAEGFRDKIADLALDFVQDGAVIMIHAYSRVVMALLLRAAAANRRFKVLVTEAKPTLKGFKAAGALREHGIPAEVILDAAIGHYMQSVDMVLVGAEGVVENGGLINQIGTFTMAVMAQSFNVPFYAVAESYKFVRAFPLGHDDLPSCASAALIGPVSAGQRSKFRAVDVAESVAPEHAVLMVGKHATIDYTPPSYITLLFTDLGLLTPSSVSDELIKLYY